MFGFPTPKPTLIRSQDGVAMNERYTEDERDTEEKNRQMNVVTRVINDVSAGRRDDVRRRVTRKILRLGVVVGVFLVVSAILVTSAWAAFSDTTSNATNNWNDHDVQIVDDDSGSAMFNAVHMAPDDVIVNCIVVTYQGSLVPADVSIYGTSGGSLDAYLDLTIEEGSGGSFGDCTGFSLSSTLFNNMLANFAATHTNFGNGATGWSPAVNPESLTYRFTLTLQDNNLAQGLSTTGTFTWEAQNQ